MMKTLTDTSTLSIESNDDIQLACEYLAKRDKIISGLVKTLGIVELPHRDHKSLFSSLCEAIIHQQLNGKAALAIHTRFNLLFSEKNRTPRPDQVLSASDQELRSAGLSSAKVLALRDLSQKVLIKEIPTLNQASRMTNEEIIESLVKVHGIGRWSAQMFLIFTLRRSDVLPIDDFGVKKGYSIAYNNNIMPASQDLLKCGQRWTPYSTVASLYLWKVANLA